MKIHIDSFSGKVVDLKRGQRTHENILEVLSKHPRISTWDMGELPWLRNAINELKLYGFIVEQDEPYPWHKYKVTDTGLSYMKRILID